MKVFTRRSKSVCPSIIPSPSQSAKRAVRQSGSIQSGSQLVRQSVSGQSVCQSVNQWVSYGVILSLRCSVC